jgi:hypothetical protein
VKKYRKVDWIQATERPSKQEPPVSMRADRALFGIAKIRDLEKKALGTSEIAKALKIGRASVYRALLSAP